MDIPREEIQEKKDYLKEIEVIRYIHYRDLYPEINYHNFQTCTKVDFKSRGVECNPENVRKIWGTLFFELGRENNYEESEIIFTHKSKSGSEYIVTKNGDVYRLADHWGATASCEWTLDGHGELRMSVMTNEEWKIGVANLKDFQIFRRRDDRRRDILVNPEWKEKIKVIIPLAEILKNIKFSPEFNELPGEDKKLVGETLGKFIYTLKEIE